MQKTYTKRFILKNSGCYQLTEGKVENLLFFKGNTITTAEEILSLDISTKDKYWFFCNKVFTKEQNQLIAISVAEIVLSIYEAMYPENKATREVIEAGKLYIKGHISLDELRVKRDAAAAADVANAVVYAVANAVGAAADAADTVADVTDAVADSAYAAGIKIKLLVNLKDFIKNN